MAAVVGEWAAPPPDFRVHFMVQAFPAHEFQYVRSLRGAINGDVLLYEHLPTGEAVVMKKMDTAQILSSSLEGTRSEDSVNEIGVYTFLREQAAALGQAYPAHLVRCRAVYQDARHTYLAMDLASDGELFDIVSEAGGLGEEASMPLVRQILSGLCLLHEMGIAHRDISLENVLQHTEDVPAEASAHDATAPVAKILDFGQAVSCGHTTPAAGPGLAHGVVGKQYYRPPEVRNPAGYDARAVDIFAMGVAIFIMILGIPPWEHPVPGGDPRFDFIQRQGVPALIATWGLGDRMSPHTSGMLTRMLAANPLQRPSAREVADHFAPR